MIRYALAIYAWFAFTNWAIACAIHPVAFSDFPKSFVSPDYNKPLPKGIFEAWFDKATQRYKHGILGDAIEPSSLGVYSDQDRISCGSHLDLDPLYVFEDITPRIADVTGDGKNEVVVIRSHVDKGAQLAVYAMRSQKLTLIASTPYIGKRHRWLAPIGIADFNGDGDMDIAYIDRPHLAKILRIVSYRDGKLVETATTANLTNHKIGWNFIAGGVRTCGQGPEMITADGDWQHIIATRMVGDKLVSKKIGTYKGPKSLTAALSC